MANKIIIDNRTELSDLDAMCLVKSIIKEGRISNNDKQYCYGTTINIEGNLYGIWTEVNKKSDRFVITDKN